MTGLDDLHRMQQVVQAQYDQKQQYFQKLTTKEANLRQELARLSEQARAASGTDIALQAIGADILWRGWVGRAKTQLNIELAQTLALKRYHLSDVKKAYGKVLVVEELIQQTQSEARKAQSEQVLQRAIEQHLYGDA